MENQITKAEWLARKEARETANTSKVVTEPVMTNAERSEHLGLAFVHLGTAFLFMPFAVWGLYYVFPKSTCYMIDVVRLALGQTLTSSCW